MTIATSPLAIAREVRDTMIVQVEDAARALLLTDENANAEKAVKALDAMLVVATAQIEGLSTSSRGYAERDMDENVRKSLTRARVHVSKLKTLHYLDREAQR